MQRDRNSIRKLLPKPSDWVKMVASCVPILRVQDQNTARVDMLEILKYLKNFLMGRKLVNWVNIIALKYPGGGVGISPEFYQNRL